MDTRAKIIGVDAACALARGARPAVLVTGSFDVLGAAHVRELARVRETLADGVLIVAVTAPAKPVLDARARAELVAALGMVDYVVSSEEPHVGTLLAAFPAERLIRLEAAHSGLMRELIQHVRRRQAQ